MQQDTAQTLVAIPCRYEVVSFCFLLRSLKMC